MKIIIYDDKYRDDMIFMILEAKNALGRVPGLNDDLLDIKSNYLDKGDMFWLAVNDDDRVIGSVGYNSNGDSDSVTLHRHFVKYNLKHNGIGTKLLITAENHILSKNKKTVFVNLGIGDEWFESRSFYKKHGYVEYEPNRMKKELSNGKTEKETKKEKNS